jgi:putative nucleotidyltransferase with HDIG domain
MELRILIVDDDHLSLDGMKQILNYLKPDWKLFFASNGEEALHLLDEIDIDIIISDMKMPLMDGGELMAKVKGVKPSIVRIILSAYSDKELMIKASKNAHQFLAKPVDNAVLVKIIEKVYSLQSILHNKNIIKLTNGVKNLPSLPELYLKIEEELKRPNPSIKRIDEIITKDMIMTAKILQIVNSAFFGLPQRIINPLQAINFLGIEVIKALVLLVHFFSTDSSNEMYHAHLTKLWDDSLKVATLSKKIALAEKLDNKLVEEAFVGSLLHDIGKLVLWQIDDYFANLNKQMRDFKISVTAAEYSLFETSHAEVGAYLLGVWGLPDPLIEMVAFHHKPSNSHDLSFSPLTILHASNHIISKEPLDEAYLTDFTLQSTVNKWIRHFAPPVEQEDENPEEEN